MFRVENNVPDVYVSESRDFQLVSRLYDLVFQNTRHSIDTMENISDTHRINPTLLPLLATKIGFFDSIYVSDESYRKLLCAFPHIIRYKGSLRAVRLCINLFEKITNTSVYFEESQFSSYKHGCNEILIQLNMYTPDIDLLQKLIAYVKPTGLVVTYQVMSTISVDEPDYITEDRASVSNVSSERDTGNVSSVSGDYNNSYGHVGFTQVTHNDILGGK